MNTVPAGRFRNKAARAGTSIPWVEGLARWGYLAKGLVYSIVGVLALQVAFGEGGATTDSEGALRTIAQQSFGRVLLALTAIGLLGYVLWRFVQAIRDPEGKGRDAGGVVKRVGYAISGVVYLGLAFVAGRMALGMAGGGGDSKETWTATLLSQPFGPWLVGLVGLVIIGVGGYHFYQAYEASFMRHYEGYRMDAAQRTWARRVGRFGLSARGVTFALIGLFFIQAARQSDPDEAQGLGAAFQKLAEQPFGPWLLGVVAAGFVAYGLYCFSRAWYRRFSTG